MSRRLRGSSFGVESPVVELQPMDRIMAGLELQRAKIPAILSEKEAAQILGINPDLMRELRRLKLLNPLGDHGDQAPKRYAAIEILQITSDEGRLRAIDAAQTEYWRRKNSARTSSGAGTISGVDGALATS